MERPPSYRWMQLFMGIICMVMIANLQYGWTLFANAGLLYTAKGTASLLVPLSSVLTAATGSWHAVFLVAGIMNIAAALLAWFVLRPMRRKVIEASAAEATPAAAPRAVAA
jgi:hypothetical protein